MLHFSLRNTGRRPSSSRALPGGCPAIRPTDRLCRCSRHSARTSLGCRRPRPGRNPRAAPAVLRPPSLDSPARVTARPVLAPRSVQCSCSVEQRRVSPAVHCVFTLLWSVYHNEWCLDRVRSQRPRPARNRHKRVRFQPGR